MSTYDYYSKLALKELEIEYNNCAGDSEESAVCTQRNSEERSKIEKYLLPLRAEKAAKDAELVEKCRHLNEAIASKKGLIKAEEDKISVIEGEISKVSDQLKILKGSKAIVASEEVDKKISEFEQEIAQKKEKIELIIHGALSTLSEELRTLNGAIEIIKNSD